ncbi:2-phospho-L-lactate guanylyltransferase [Novipirellula aureliae]|uniref:2-phospho-L-lactate guanylyltransferase n=1 Tax=Novipirellula aureliae TaxID=2527966 RepID=A0A5C6DHL7_9BACT|nr:TIGR04282 family arsenosugar biosynthesis glycosyltransferase [Novipirellula aureliae]TWU35675.1 2-phospho-L-lactate guanylyltransferase [Novipirellula aureliae]
MQNRSNRKNGYATIAIMAKYWNAGDVKTRLGSSIGMAAAAHLHRIFTLFLCQTLNDAADRHLLAITPLSQQSHFANALKTHVPNNKWHLVDQGIGDLGSRMSNLFQTQFTNLADSAPLVLIGADCPLIDPSTVREATDRLAEHDVVLGPAVDGGYYLIGLAAPWRDSYDRLFREMPWGSSHVLETTRKRIQTGRLTCHLLCEREDVDTVIELNRLRSHLKSARKSNDRLAKLANSIDRILIE